MRLKKMLALSLKLMRIHLLDGKVVIQQDCGSKEINVIYKHGKEKSIPISYTAGAFSISQFRLTQAHIVDTSQNKALAIITCAGGSSKILYCLLEDLPNAIPGHTNSLWESVQFYVTDITKGIQNDSLIVKSLFGLEKSITLKRLND
ncbi:hypothetical protein DID76_03600 [Candidatus Marinamargulisbacteria bacterium SCGC AG-414-C22]|nr:hypothetical protein DID76_03600 [Candidatus Marinamargulisbacteria bacterium SCGC AG-414-C22]